MLIEPLLFPITIGAVGAVLLWTLRRLIPADAPGWLRPPGWLLPFWLVGIAFALALGVLGQAGMREL